MFPNLLDIVAKIFLRNRLNGDFEIGYIFSGTEAIQQNAQTALVISGYENKPPGIIRGGSLTSLILSHIFSSF